MPSDRASPVSRAATASGARAARPTSSIAIQAARTVSASRPVAALLTGVALSLGTPWGLFRHYWVVVSLGLTVFAAAILLLHLPDVGATADVARAADGAGLSRLGGDLPHAEGGLLVLLAITVLNVYKPRGLTPYGWRKQQEEQARRPPRAPVVRPEADRPARAAGRPDAPRSG